MDTSRMIDIEELPGSRVVDRDAMTALADRARRYLLGQKWCRSIHRGYLERGVAPILAVFYFEIEPENADDAVWAIVGDIPPAYMDTESCPTGEKALDAYLYCMDEWVQAVRQSQPVDALIPVGYADSGLPMEPTRDAAEVLARKLQGIREMLIPWFAEAPWEEEPAET